MISPFWHYQLPLPILETPLQTFSDGCIAGFQLAIADYVAR